MATSAATKSAAAKAEAAEATKAETKSKPKGEGRVNQAAAFQALAEANGWKVTEIKVSDLPDGAHKYAKSVGGTNQSGLKATKGDSSIVIATFTGRSGQAGRMSAGYLVKGDSTRNLGVVYQIMKALETGDAVTKDDSRKRGTKAEQAERVEAKPAKAESTKKAAPAKAAKQEVTPIPKKVGAAKKSA